MNLRPHSKHKNLQKAFVLAITLFLILFFFLKIPYAPHILKEYVFLLARPLWNGGSALTDEAKGIFGELIPREALLFENEELKEKARELDGIKIALRALEQENSELKELLGRRDLEKESVLGAVLVRPSQTPYDIFIIDVGRDHGIEAGNLAVFGETVLGRVIEVFEHESKIQLFSTPGLATNVLIGNENIQAEVYGRGGGNFYIDLDRDVEVFQDEIIMLPGIEGLVLGVVGEIRQKPADASKQILFKTPVNIYEIKWMEIFLES